MRSLLFLCQCWRKRSHTICSLKGRLFSWCYVGGYFFVWVFFNVDPVEHVSAVPGLIFSCVIELLTRSGVGRTAYFYKGTGQLLVSLFTLRRAILGVRPLWRIYLQSVLLLEIKLVVPYKWNHSTGCRKSEAVIQVWMDIKNPNAVGCKWPHALLIQKE